MRRTVQKPAILIVTELYPNASNAFLGTFVQQPLERLADTFAITVLTTHFIWYTKRLQQHQPVHRVENGITIHSIPHYPWWVVGLEALKVISKPTEFWLNKRRNARRLLTLATKLHRAHPFSLVHGHEVYVGDEAAPIGAALGIPSLFTLHGVYENHRNNFGERVVADAIKHMNQMTTCTAVSQIAADSYTHHGVSQPFLSLPNGVTTPHEHSAPTNERGEIRFLSIGFLAPEKRFGMSIRALANVRKHGVPASLHIIGHGAEQKKLSHLARSLGVEQHVTFTPAVPPEKLKIHYVQADVLLHPSVLESFSMVCLEAMACGRPVVCTRGIGLVEYLQPGRDALVIPPDDQEAFNAAALSLATSAQLRQDIGRAAIGVAKRLSWEHHTATLTALYRAHAK